MIEKMLRTPGATLARGTFNDAVVVPGRWVARFPRADLADARRRARALDRIGRLGLPFAVPEVLADRLDLPLGEAHVVISYLPGEQAETASDEAVREVLDALAAVEPDAGLRALLDEPLRHAGGARAAETITELVFPLLDDDERDQASQVLRRRPGAGRGRVRELRLAAGRARPARPVRPRPHHAAMFPLTGAASAIRQNADPDRFLAWFRRRCAVREHPPIRRTH